MTDWLNDFLEYSAGGESPPKFMFWTGVVTIAAVLRRKVWIDMVRFQWTPNFYVLLVGPPGGPRKTTSMNIGFGLLKRVEGINFGPQIITWQQLVTHMAEAREKFTLPDGEIFECSCVTIKVSEFGTFFDPENRELVDNLTNMWDSTIETIKKETRTMGSDEIVNPWLNIIAGTTPDWLDKNFSSNLVGGGFASRPIYLYEDRPEVDIAYPSEEPDAQQDEKAAALVERLKEFGLLSGEFTLTPAAIDWGTKWYLDFRSKQRGLNEQDAGFLERQQAHLHKLAMVLCVSRGGWPNIDVQDLQEADRRLRDLEPDARFIFSRMGRTRMSTAASRIVEVLRRVGPIKKSVLFRKHFFQWMSSEEFEIALKSVRDAGMIHMTGPLEDQLITLKEAE